MPEELATIPLPDTEGHTLVCSFNLDQTDWKVYEDLRTRDGALTFISSTGNKTVPVAIVNEFVDGDIYRWGSLMAGALVGSLPLVVLYAFFVEHYVSAMTGAVKE